MRILFIGDVFGQPGRHLLAERLPGLLVEQRVELCIANGENAAGGIGITRTIASKLLHYGAQVITGGNHSLAHTGDDPGVLEVRHLLRPHNMPPGNPGTGSTVFALPDGRKVAVVSLQGRTYFHETFDCPFRTGAALVAELRNTTPIIIVDFHAEASSEKISLACHLDGTVSALLGTHTHVQTADERILPGGTAFITDVGMTGPEDSVIGMRKEQVVQRFLTQGRVRFEPARDAPMLNAVVLDIDEASGKAFGIERIFERHGA
jgi:2',3'-cyclic-nucleotide 2'-phosphodiesterase